MFAEIESLLQPDEDFPLGPELFQTVVVSPVWRKQVQNNVPKIYKKPTVLRFSFNPPFQVVLISNTLDGSICQRADHAVTGTGADYKIIRKIRDIVNIQQKDIFSLLLLKCIDNTACKF